MYADNNRMIEVSQADKERLLERADQSRAEANELKSRLADLAPLEARLATSITTIAQLTAELNSTKAALADAERTSTHLMGEMGLFGRPRPNVQDTVKLRCRTSRGMLAMLESAACLDLQRELAAVAQAAKVEDLASQLKAERGMSKGAREECARANGRVAHLSCHRDAEVRHSNVVESPKGA